MNREIITSPYYGTINNILIKKDSRIYEWELLFTIKSKEECNEEVRVSLAGKIDSLEVDKGDEVIPGMVLAYIYEDLVSSGSD